MEAIQEQRAKMLAELLEKAGMNSGLLLMQSQVVLRTPGSPYTDSPTTFFEPDLNNAVELGLLKPTRITGSYSWDWCVLNGPLSKQESPAR